MHPCEEDLVCKASIERVPYFNAPIYLENKSQIGKVDEIFGPMNAYVSYRARYSRHISIRVVAHIYMSYTVHTYAVIFHQTTSRHEGIFIQIRSEGIILRNKSCMYI